MSTETIKNLIQRHLLEKIAGGEFLVGDKLPTENELAQHFATNRMNAHRAVKSLEELGIVKRNKRQGTFVIRKLTEPQVINGPIGQNKRVQALMSKCDVDHININDLAFFEVELRLARRGMTMEQAYLPESLDRKSLEELLRSRSKQCPDCLILFPKATDSDCLMDNSDLIYRYYRRNVFVFEKGSRPPAEWLFNVIGPDPFSEGILVCEYLAAKDLRNVVFLHIETGERNKHWLSERLRGLRFAMRTETNWKFDVWKIRHEGFAETFLQMLEKSPGHNVFLTGNDEQASWAMNALGSFGLRVLEDFSIISFDNNPAYRHLNLTTVAPPLIEIGRILGRLIDEGFYSDYEIETTMHLKVASKIIERGSCVGARSKSV